MQPMSRLILYRAVHYEDWSGSPSPDLINVAVDDVLKRVTEAKVSEQIIQELQGMCPRMPADRTWLVLATYELWTGDKVRAVEHPFETGATDHQMEELMLRNLQRLRAQYHPQAKERAQAAKSRAPEGGDPKTVDNTVDRMEEDDVGTTEEPRVKKNPTELSKRNVRKLRKRPGAIKWVRKLGQLLENQNDWEMELPPLGAKCLEDHPEYGQVRETIRERRGTGRESQRTPA